ncbi:transcriptional regulator [Candidatus Gracilibacteria bacterium HOT-871]|nr:transcriptional regulator [Candidatus Gracilibacteria bacterium HOT-871]RKW20463.1 MAG: transcriptional regulator [Candidatus Gracilibacteria bacterium]
MKNIIKQERKNLKLTQAELADMVDVRRETIVFMESGKYNPSLELAYKVSKVFGKTIEELFIFGEEE